ncbi:DUF6479 family protein [Streptomyces sp. NPDC059785]|uniref:DUF6479 family protein n=1 Tax=unclassified Streptomyces TaxID=2593676 RepID=UPI00364CD366
MMATEYELAVSNHAWAVLIAFVCGLIIAGALIWAVRMGIDVRRREPAPPRPDEQPRLPDGGPIGETLETREPDEIPVAGDESERLRPNNLHPWPTKRADEQPAGRPRWDRGSSGSFGGGGPGRT